MSDKFEFIPTLWSGAVLATLQKSSVFESLCNRDYEGEVKHGNSLKIASVSNPHVKDYQKNEKIDYDLIDGSESELKISQQKYFAVRCDDVDTVQSNASLLQAATSGAGYELADTMDLYLAGLLKKSAAITMDTQASSAMEWNSSKGLETIAKINRLLDDAKSPEKSRWCVVPTFVAEQLTLELAGKLTQNNAIVSSGYIGSVFGLPIYKSVNAGNAILCGNTNAITLANQIYATEHLRLQDTFADAVRGLHVYGAKVTRPEICACIHVKEKGAK